MSKQMLSIGQLRATSEGQRMSTQSQVPYRRMSVDGEGISGEELHPRAAEAIALMTKSLRDIDGITGDSKELAADLTRVVRLCWGEAGVMAVSRAGASKGEDPKPKSTSPVTVGEPNIAAMSLGGRQRMGLLEEPSITALGELVRTGRATQAEGQHMAIAPEEKRRTFIESRAPLPAGTMPY